MEKRLIDNLKKIKDLAIATNGRSADDENKLLMIIGICQLAEVDYQKEKEAPKDASNR